MNSRWQQRRRGNPPWLPSKGGQAQGPAPTDVVMNAPQTRLFRQAATPYNGRRKGPSGRRLLKVGNIRESRPSIIESSQ